MSTTLLEREDVILNRQEITTKGNDILKAIKGKLTDVSINEDQINTYITDISGVRYFMADIDMNKNSHIFYIDQVIDERPKVIIINTTSEELVMFDIDDIESIIKYVNHGDKSKLYLTKSEKKYDNWDFIFTKSANMGGAHKTYFKLLNEYLEKNTIVKTPEERRLVLLGVEEVRNAEPINPMPVAVEDIIRNASSVLAQSTIQRDVVMDIRQVPETINPMEQIPGPDDNTELEDMDEESKRIYDRIMYAPSALIPDPQNPDLSVPAIRTAMDDRRKKALQEISEYKKGVEDAGKRTPLSNRRI